jgi:multidrug transporter EmrE-like cation transporter
MIRSVLVFIVFLVSSTGGEIAITYGMKEVGEPERLRPGALLVFLGRALRSVWFWVGIPQLALSFYLLLLLLSWEPISLVIPASALNPYVLGTLAAKYVLGEQISAQRWAGVALVCAGVALVAIS